MTQTSSNPVASFASLLTGLVAPKAASPASRGKQKNDSWNDDALADDVATLSYEQALRAHTRYRPSNPNLPGFYPADPRPTPPAPALANAAAPAGPASPVCARPSLPSEGRKAASITIRLSQAECAQLRDRAAAAGLSVSAYLRSCVFEVESLRAEVKQTVAQLRTAAETQSASCAVSVPHRTPASGQKTLRSRLLSQVFPQFFTRFFLRLGHRTPRVAHA